MLRPVSTPVHTSQECTHPSTHPSISSIHPCTTTTYIFLVHLTSYILHLTSYILLVLTVLNYSYRRPVLGLAWDFGPTEDGGEEWESPRVHTCTSMSMTCVCVRGVDAVGGEGALCRRGCERRGVRALCTAPCSLRFFPCVYRVRGGHTQYGRTGASRGRRREPAAVFRQAVR
jgi:hypothetical protein